MIQTRSFLSNSALFLAASLLAAATSFAQTAGSWQKGKDLSVGRYSPTATVLPNGKVLIAGGYDGTQTSRSVQLYDSVAGALTTTGSLSTGRNFATATLLDNGKVLIAGGFNSTLGTQGTAELYDPAKGSFSTLKNRMVSPRELYTATKLWNGKVLFVGGFNTGAGRTLTTAELFDPATTKFTATGSMKTPYGRFGHDALLIPGTHKVLVVGGKERRSSTDWRSLSTAEIYDADKGTFTLAGTMAYTRDRVTVAWIASAGKALVIGGKAEAQGVSSDVTTCEWYDVTTGTFSPGPSLAQGRMAHTLTALADGSFLVVGGWNVSQNQTLNTAERLVPNATAPQGWTFQSAGTLIDSRHDHAAVLLKSGQALIIGGKKVYPDGAAFWLKGMETYAP